MVSVHNTPSSLCDFVTDGTLACVLVPQWAWASSPRSTSRYNGSDTIAHVFCLIGSRGKQAEGKEQTVNKENT